MILIVCWYESHRYNYRNARVETLLIYAQSIYLIFASVYVCKETVEHLLLAHGEGHHHHSGDEFVELTGYVSYIATLTYDVDQCSGVQN